MKELNWWGAYSDSLKGKIVDEAFSHPAKMAWGLTMRIFQHLFDEGWLKEGDLVADPFGGIGVTALAAASFGCPCILVELEEKFVDLAEQNFELHREQWEKMGKPLPIILQGDSRQFSSIIREAVDSIITSPPFSFRQPPIDQRAGKEDLHLVQVDNYGDAKGQIGVMKEGKLDEVVAVITSPPYAAEINRDRASEPYAKGKDDYRRGGLSQYEVYGQSNGQLGGMPEGDLPEIVAGIITSPPYAESLQPETEEQTRRRQERIAKAKTIHNGRALEKPSPGKAALGGGYGVSEGQLGAMKEGDFEGVVNGVITSPPYAIDPKNIYHTKEGKTLQDYDEAGGYKPQARGRMGYSPRPDNLGNLPEGSHEAVVDAVVTSPPYEGTHIGLPEEQALASQGRGREIGGKNYATDENNIGNQQGDTYWEAVSEVYQECFKALKPNGVCCVVVKAFVRNKKIVDLPSQTLELLEAIGFEPLERIRAWMTSPVTQKSLMPDMVQDYTKKRASFFRCLYESKYPENRIDFEEVLVVRKPNSDCH